MFRFRDCDGKPLAEQFGGSMLDHMGRERDFDIEKDEVDYYLRLTLQQQGNDKNTLYVTGFEEAGLALFNRTAIELWQKMTTENIDNSHFVEKLSDTVFDILVSAYVNKKDKVLWTFRSVTNCYIDDESPIN